VERTFEGFVERLREEAFPEWALGLLEAHRELVVAEARPA
jgi:hypothetical protein